jgi:cell division protein FtsB
MVGDKIDTKEVGGAVQRVLNRQLRRIFALQIALMLIIVLAMAAGFFRASMERQAQQDFQTALFENIEDRLISRQEVVELRAEIRKLTASNRHLSQSADKLRVRVAELNKELNKPPR